MKKYEVSNYYYLNSKKQINKNEINSGATMFDGQWFTNFNESNVINIEKNNKISIYVPSTIDIDKTNENIKEVIRDVKREIKENTEEYYTQGAWRTHDNKIVYENICILTINTNENNFEKKINEFIKIANNLKKELNQEAVSIGVNDGLLII